MTNIINRILGRIIFRPPSKADRQQLIVEKGQIQAEIRQTRREIARSSTQQPQLQVRLDQLMAQEYQVRVAIDQQSQ